MAARAAARAARAATVATAATAGEMAERVVAMEGMAVGWVAGSMEGAAREAPAVVEVAEAVKATEAVEDRKAGMVAAAHHGSIHCIHRGKSRKSVRNQGPRN